MIQFPIGQYGEISYRRELTEMLQSAAVGTTLTVADVRIRIMLLDSLESLPEDADTWEVSAVQAMYVRTMVTNATYVRATRELLAFIEAFTE